MIRRAAIPARCAATSSSPRAPASSPPCLWCTKIAGSIPISRMSRGARRPKDSWRWRPMDCFRGGYPGNDDDGRALQAELDPAKLRHDMLNSARF